MKRNARPSAARKGPRTVLSGHSNQESGAVSHDYPCSSWLKSYQLSNWHKANYFVVRCKKALLQFILAEEQVLAAVVSTLAANNIRILNLQKDG